MRADNVGAPVTPQQWNYIHDMGGALRSSLDNVSAVFAPSCIGHAVLSKRDWVNIRIDDISLPDALRCWEHSTRQRRKRHDKLKRSTETTLAAELAPHAHPNQRHQRHRQRQQQQQQQRLNNNNKNSSNNAAQSASSSSPAQRKRNHLSKEQREERKRRRLERQQRKQRRREQQQQQRQNNNNKRRRQPLTAAQQLERKQQRQQRRRKQQQERKQQQKQLISPTQHEQPESQPQSDPPKRRASNNASKPASSSAAASVHRKRQRVPRVPQKCGLRLLERCSWPQCNHSCPTLTNPLTGEEMRFLELLTSFGLDIEAVAAALGVDMHTLSNMERTELVNLLTQQVS